MRECGAAFWIEKAAQDKLRKLQDTTATAIYFALLRLHNDRGNGQWFKASSAGIADVAGVSKRAVFSKLPLLKAARLILVKSGKSNSKNKAHEMNTFAIVWACAGKSEGDEQASQGAYANDAQPLVQTRDASSAGEKEHSEGFKEPFKSVVAFAPQPFCEAVGEAQLNGAKTRWENEN